MADRIALSGSILDCMPLNETYFERSVFLLSWVETFIGVNNIEPLTSEGWLKEFRALSMSETFPLVVRVPPIEKY